MLLKTIVDTPLGVMIAGASDAGICLFDFDNRSRLAAIIRRIEEYYDTEFQDGDSPLFSQLKTEIDEYFMGQRRFFSVKLDLVGTDFQKQVWNALLNIPYAATRSYKQQSLSLGSDKNTRAVANANGDNGIAIIVPCHRVIGENGSLTGYGGGLERKKWLLDHERRYAGKPGQATLF